jgi:hypothetical protein
LAFAALRKQIDASAPPPGTLGPFALADTEALKQSFIQAGFKDIKIDTLQITFEFDSPKGTHTVPPSDYSTHSCHVSEPRRGSEEAGVGLSITEVVWQYADSHGRVNLDNEVLSIVARN